MRGVSSWGLTAALIVGLGGAVETAKGSDDDGKAVAPKGLLAGLFADKSKPQAKPALKSVEEKLEPPSSVDTTALQWEKHKNALMRRMDVCDRLRRVALDSGNEALMTQADRLETRAQEIFRRQTANLPVSPLTASKPVGQQKDASETGGLKEKNVEERSSLPPRTPRSLGASGLNGSMDRREQAILNGSSMGEDKP